MRVLRVLASLLFMLAGCEKPAGSLTALGARGRACAEAQRGTGSTWNAAASHRTVECLCAVESLPCPDHLQSIGRYPDQAVTFDSLLAYANQRASHGVYGPAALAAGAASSSASPRAETREQARTLLDAIDGRGPFFLRLEFMIADLFRETRKPSNLALILAPELVGPVLEGLGALGKAGAAWRESEMVGIGAHAIDHALPELAPLSMSAARGELGMASVRAFPQEIALSYSRLKSALLEDQANARIAMNNGRQLPILAANASRLRPASRPVYFVRFNNNVTLGETTWNGLIRLSPDLKHHDLLCTFDHECVHAFLTPFADSALGRFRIGARKWGYIKTSSLRYLEEAAAETYSQVKTGGPLHKMIWNGLKFPLQTNYQIRFRPGFSNIGKVKQFQLGVPLEVATYGGASHLGYRGVRRLGDVVSQLRSGQNQVPNADR